MTTKASRKLSRYLDSLSQTDLFQCLIRAQQRQAFWDGAARLLHSRLARLTSQPVVSTEHDDLMTASQVSKRLGLTKARVYELLRSHDLPAVRIGRQVRINRQDVQEFIKTRRSS